MRLQERKIFAANETVHSSNAQSRIAWQKRNFSTINSTLAVMLIESLLDVS